MRHLDQNWNDYHTRVSRSLAQDDGQLTDAQKRMSVEIIERSKTAWPELLSALLAVGEATTLTDDQQRQLADLQQLLDQRAWSQIEDNTVLRSAETEAWYRCWEKLQAFSSQELAQADGPLTFVQLFSQPQELRGRLVKVTGTAGGVIELMRVTANWASTAISCWGCSPHREVVLRSSSTALIFPLVSLMSNKRTRAGKDCRSTRTWR